MEKNQNEPFFLWVNYQDPHPAFTCPPPYHTMYNPDDIEIGEDWEFSSEEEPVRNKVWRVHSEMETYPERAYREAVAHYMGQITYVDDSIDRIVDSLEQNGLEKKKSFSFSPIMGNCWEAIT